MRVTASEVHDPVHHGGRTLNSYLVVNVWVFPGLEPPFLGSRGGVKRVEVCIPTPHEHDAIRYGRRSMHHIACLEFPIQRSGPGIERVDVSIPTAEING